MILSRFLRLIFVTLIFVVNSGALLAQNNSIKGIITDEYGIAMPGATVVINEIYKTTVSDQEGKFILVNIPNGKHSLTVQYLGFLDTQKEVTVLGSKTAFIPIVLISKSVELDDVKIISYGVSGQARALNAQKSNMNITNIVATDQIGKFPDANIGDAIKRIPGITMQVDQGEARNIIVRGLSPQLNSVTLNGSRVPSAEGDNRNVQMDLIPSDMIQTIEVNKAVTPDMEADALGGSVNLITRTAPQSFRLSATLGSGINFITDKSILNGSFLVGDRSKNKKFGWMLSASITDNDFGSHNIEAEWTDEFKYYTGADDAEGEPILEEVSVAPYTKEFEIRTYLVQRIRRSFAANFDYQFDNNHTMFLKTMYNWRDDRENRFRLKHKILDAEDIEIDDFSVTNRSLTRFPVEVQRQTKGGVNNDRNKNRRLEDQRMQNYSLGGNHLFGTVKINWMASFAQASEERLNERYAEYESEYSVYNDNSDPEFPIFRAVNPTEATDLSNFEYGEITEENQYTKEEDINFFANVELPSDFFGKEEGSIKFGIRSRLKRKLRRNDFFEFDLKDDFATLSDVGTRNYTDSDFLAGNQYQAGVYADENWLGSLNLQNGESVPDEFLRANFDVEEDVMAGYVMTTQKLSDKLSILGGVRLEHTKISATGNQIKDEEDVIGKITKEKTYTNVLPGVHLKYNMSTQTLFRFAWTNTIARPNYVDLSPTLDVISDDEEIFVGNPNLDPTTSMNFDLMGEHYFTSVGIVSGGVFYKKINDFIYTFKEKTTDNTFGADTSEFDVFQPLNGDGASVFGVEMAFQRKLDFLPGFAKNFSIYLNYTYLTSSAKGIRNEDGEERTDLDLPNTAPHLFNGSLGYNDTKFSIRLSTNFSDAYIDEIGGNTFEDRYYDKQLFLDFNASYAITKSLSIYADVNNITNQPLRFYQGISQRTMQAEYYDRRLTFGLKYDLFKK
ncbi:TonB-dependent receptor [Aquimarina longa]|uniref:TonB-dependent receptor n=1 Tax=Aquimarina longa TaxID=1080221 RepID=UPI000784A38D|nr:TonB-dependent receptor [Aquimarina longa]